MNNKEFDKHILEKLKDLGTGPTTPKNDWESFSSLLQQDEDFKDISFDEKVAKKLDKKVPFNSLHWVILKNRLEIEARIRKEVYTTKILESVLVLLVAFTFIHLQTVKRADQELTPEQIAINNSILFPETAIFTSAATYGQSKVLEPQAHNKADETPLKRIGNNLIELPEVSNGIIPSWRQYFFLKRTMDVAPPVVPIQNIEVQSNGSTPTTMMQEKDNTDQTKNQPTSASPLVCSSLHIEPFNMDEHYPSFHMRSQPITKESYIYVQAFKDENFIKSPRDEKFNIDAYTALSRDFGIGVGFGKRYNKLDAEIGLNYQRVQYSPESVSEILLTTDNYAVINTLNEIRFDIIQVPLNFRYHYFENKNNTFGLWASLGTGLNGIFLSKYNLDIERIPIASVNPAENSNLEEERGQRYNDLDEKNFHQGLAESGSFFDNFYLSAQIGIGADFKLGPKLKGSVSLNYHKSLAPSGIGPNDDMIDAIRGGLGVKYTL